MKQPKLTPVELDLFLCLENIFDSIQITNTVPFPVIETEEKLCFQLITLEKLATSLDLTYFENLSNEFDKEGKQIIFIWEDIWIKKREIVLSRLSALAQNSIKLHGRTTVCKRIEKKEYITFLSQNHLQVPANAKFKFGLYLKEQLVAVAGFSAPKKYYRDDEVSRSSELIRFCNLKGHTVIGGFDKILKHFISNHDVDDIMSYADRDWSNGKSYERLGFERIENTPPTSFWVHQKEMERIYSHQTFIKLGTEDEQLLFKKGYQKIVNSGNYKYIKFLSNP